MVSRKVDGHILFGARGEKRKNVFGAKWRLRKHLFGSQRVNNFPNSDSMISDCMILVHHSEVLFILKQILSNPDLPVQQLSYDIMFTLADFYLFILLFREMELKSSPIIPLAYMIHEWKLISTHDVFWCNVEKICPEITQSNVVIITDQEELITQSIHKYFSSVPHFVSTNHIIQACKRWLRFHGVSTSLKALYYIDCIRSLLQCSTEVEYKDLPIANMVKWSQLFTQYFMANFNSNSNRLCAWATWNHDCESPTTNQSESFNCIIKHLQN